MECEEVQDLRKTLKVKMWQQTGNDLRSMEVFLTVTNKDGYEQERFIFNNILEEFLKRSGRLEPKQPKYCAPPNTREKVPETLYQEDNTCAQQLIRIAMPYANSSFTKRCSHWFISDSATESLSKHCGHTGMPDP